uniref:Protein AMBP n=1 Tax=Scleropages formosus TaxID=113540 RepID=A0A8C9SHY4_SCLFO
MMQSVVLLLFLAAGSQAHSGPPPPEPPLPTQENFDQHRFMGKWYDVAIASTCPWLKSHKGRITAETLELKPGHSSDTISLTRTAIRDGSCKQESAVYELSKVPGRLIYHSTKWATNVETYVVRTNYDEYAIVAITNKDGQKRTTTFKLYGRSVEPRPTLIDEFTQLVKEQGMSDDDIVTLKNAGECVPGEPAPEPEIQRRRRDAESVTSNTTPVNDSCLSLPDAGHCLAWFPRFFYNSTVKACQSFIYGGCEGNHNNFLTEKACLQTCRTKDACRQPIVSGPCKAYLPRWGFDSESNECVFFLYGGCHGNSNNFHSLQECEEYCGSAKKNELRAIPCTPGEICTQPSSNYCHEAPERGPCNASFPHFYYNASLMACQRFTYGGCQGNKNNFKTENACLQSCQTKAACTLPIVVGPCKAFAPRWAFDSQSGKCVFFVYGGCQGNSNNFYSQSECQEFCEATKGDPCLSPPDEGPCNAFFPRYYYNSTLMTCTTFTYGGCQANQNNFPTERACQESCRTAAACRLPTVIGPCKAAFRRWTFDSVKGECVPFIYGGCEGNGNNFYTKKECEKFCGNMPMAARAEPCLPGEACAPASSDDCLGAPETGLCDSSFQRFYYNSSTMTCEPFTYGGCPGNKNNFETEKECLQNCHSEVACRQPIVPGPCMARFPRWAFDAVKGKCMPFIYGGCKGNGNNFHSKKSCEELCGDMEGDPCLSPPDAGPCDGAFVHFYYNSTLMACENFTYGGCQGNQNNFLTESKCLQSCRTPAACRLPVVTGPCKAAFPRWAFQRDNCVPFTYGGCDGNSNNFDSKTECEKYCGVSEDGDEEVMEVS